MSVTPPSQPEPEDPHAGSEDDPRRELDARDQHPVLPPRRYEGPSGELEIPHSTPTVMDRLSAASVPLATLAFFLIGFGTGMWWVAWVVFLIPPVLRAWSKPGR